MSKVEQIKVVIVDDHEIFRTGLKMQLTQIKSIKVVGDVESGEEFLELLNDIDVDVVLMDIKMLSISSEKKLCPSFIHLMAFSMSLIPIFLRIKPFAPTSRIFCKYSSSPNIDKAKTFISGLISVSQDLCEL